MSPGTDFWNDRYAEPGWAYGTEPNEFLVSVVASAQPVTPSLPPVIPSAQPVTPSLPPVIPSAPPVIPSVAEGPGRAPERRSLRTPKSHSSSPRFLCLGAGEGRNAVFLAEQGYDVTAVDQSSVGLDKAQRLAAERGVSITTIEADVAEFDLGHDQWDGIVSIFFHLPAPLRREVHRRVVEALVPGALFVLEAYTPKQLEYGTGGPKVVELLMTLNELREELSGLTFEHAVELDRAFKEGRFHDGKSAVVQVVARKAQG